MTDFGKELRNELNPAPSKRPRLFGPDDIPTPPQTTNATETSEERKHIYVGTLTSARELHPIIRGLSSEDISDEDVERIVQHSGAFQYYYELFMFERRMRYEYHITSADHFKANTKASIDEIKKQISGLYELEKGKIVESDSDYVVIFCPHCVLQYVRTSRPVFVDGNRDEEAGLTRMERDLSNNGIVTIHSIPFYDTLHLFQSDANK